MVAPFGDMPREEITLACCSRIQPFTEAVGCLIDFYIFILFCISFFLYYNKNQADNFIFEYVREKLFFVPIYRANPVYSCR